MCVCECVYVCIAILYNSACTSHPLKHAYLQCVLFHHTPHQWVFGVCGLCVRALRGMNEKLTLMVGLTDFQLLLYDQSHGLQQTFPGAGDGLHSQAKVRLGPS